MTIGTELRRINNVFMLHGLANGFAAGRIPEPRGLIIRGGHHSMTVGTELRRINKMSSCFMGSPMGLPLAASQSRAVLSYEAVTTRWPSGLNCADLTAVSCFMGSPMGLPLAASQNRAVLSFEAVITRWPSGLNCSEVTLASCRSEPVNGTCQLS